jgi:hypothetical protein
MKAAALILTLGFAVSGLAADTTLKGYLVDSACGAAGMSKMDGSNELTAPQDHTVACEIACAKSGYGVMVKKGMTYSFVRFDAKGSALATEILKAAKQDKAPFVAATGTLAKGTLKVTSLTEAAM